MPDAVTAVNGLRKSYDGLEAVRSIGFAVGAGFGRVTILRDGQGNLFEEGTLIDEINIVTGPSLTFYAQHGELFAKARAAFSLAIFFAKLLSQTQTWARQRNGM